MKKEKVVPAYQPTEKDQKTYAKVVGDLISGRTIISKNYNQFNNRNLYDCIDDWSKRWNGYIPVSSVLTEERSNMFLNFTRNLVISYLSKVALQRPKIKIIAVDKKHNVQNNRFAELITDLNEYSNNEENADARFLESALECCIKGTVIKYEGYMKQEQEMDIPDEYDASTGEMTTRKANRVIFDDCYQEIVATEDFYIANVYQSDIQKQPWVIWKKITTFEEAKTEFGHYEKFKFVKGGTYTIVSEPTTFYRNNMTTELKKGQVEVVRWYSRSKNRHVILVNGVPVYDGIIPFKDGKYPFAKGIHEPYGNDFFWGMGMPQKIMGDQDLINTLWNMMVDKTYGSLQAFGLSSDLDDLVDDTTLEPNKIRKVGDIRNWSFQTLPGVNAGEQSMLQSAIGFIKENSSIEGGGAAASRQGGKVSMRQAMMKQQEAMSKLGFSANYLEDFERDRTELRIAHLLQFYSIPKMEAVSGSKGKDIEKMMYRTIVLPNSKLQDGRTGNRVIKLVDNTEISDENKRKKLSDELSHIEQMGEDGQEEIDQSTKLPKMGPAGVPTEAVAMSIDAFDNFNLKIQVVKNSSYERNQMLDRAERLEYANWRLQLANVAPPNVDELIRWVDESYDIDSDRFKAPQQPTQLNPEAAQQAGVAAGQGASNPATTVNNSKPSVNQMLQ